ncbi:MAG: DUF4350 domain-containing protein [Spirochaetales bacterium]|nr:DUF4350 domain-containing protein [Spirochaetales bacterium]
MIKDVDKFINTRLVIFILSSIIIAAYTMIMLFGFAGTEPSPRTTGNKGDSGYYIFYNLLKRLGYKIQVWDASSGFGRDTMLFYFHYGKNQQKDFQEIKTWVGDGNVLFLIGMDSDADPVFDNTIISGDTQSVDLSPVLAEGVDTFSFESSLYFDKESRGDILLGNNQGPVLLKNKYGNGTVYLLSDALLISNRALTDENNAIVLNNLVKKYYSDALFIREPEAFRAVHPIAPLFRGKLFIITMHLLLMGIIFMLYYGIRFGNPLRKDPLARRTLQEHLNAVGFFYQKVRALHLADHYGLKYFLYQVKSVLGIKKHVSQTDLVLLLTRNYLTGYTESEVAALLSETKDTSERNLIRLRQKRNEIIDILKTGRKKVR